MTTPTPASLGYRMPAEWHPHDRTWMAFPTANPTFDSPEALHAGRQAWAAVADTVQWTAALQAGEALSKSDLPTSAAQGRSAV